MIFFKFTKIYLLIFLINVSECRKPKPDHMQGKIKPAPAGYQRPRRPKPAPAAALNNGVMQPSNSPQSPNEHLRPRKKIAMRVNSEDFLEEGSEPKSETETDTQENTPTGQISSSYEEEKTLSDSEIEEGHRHKANNRGAHHHRIHGHLRGKNFLLDNGVKLFSHGEIESGGYDEYDSNGVKNIKFSTFLFLLLLSN